MWKSEAVRKEGNEANKDEINTIKDEAGGKVSPMGAKGY